MHPLPNPAEEAERQMFVPQGYYADGSIHWLGKKPTKAVPLTDEAIKAWIDSGTLRPYGYTPRDNWMVWLRVLAWTGFLLACGAAITYPLWLR